MSISRQNNGTGIILRNVSVSCRPRVAVRGNATTMFHEFT